MHSLMAHGISRASLTDPSPWVEIFYLTSGLLDFTSSHFQCSVLEDFWAYPPVEILVFASPTGYMFTSSGFPLLYIYSMKFL